MESQGNQYVIVLNDKKNKKNTIKNDHLTSFFTEYLL